MSGQPAYLDNWESKRLKYIATYNDEVLSEETDPEREIDYVEISGISLSEGIQEVNRLVFGKAPSRARRLVRRGDILISTVRTYLKAITRVNEAAESFVASTGFCVIRPGNQTDSSFLGWAVKSESFIKEVVARSVGISYPAINSSELVKIEIPIPPLETQRRIAAFLDEKTAQIDGLIAKKRELLDRLAEKRQALITQAITKGLNPDAPMKPSGIDWLGDIPAHWEVLPLSHSILKLESGVSVNAIDRSAEGAELGVLKTSCVYTGIFNPSENKIVYDALEEQRLSCPVRKGEIIISRMNTPDLVGASGLVQNEHPNLFLPDRLWQTKFGDSSRATQEFVYFFLNSTLYRAIIASSATGTSSSMKNISKSDLLKIQIGNPPSEEQIQITRFIHKVTDSIGKQTNLINLSISNLTEYRSALITAAVTGQIAGLQ